MKSVNFTITVPVNESQTLEAEVPYEATFEYDGIGHYEFWGQRCFDRGNLVLSDCIAQPQKISFYFNGRLVQPNLAGKSNLILKAITAAFNLKDKIEQKAFEALAESE